MSIDNIKGFNEIINSKDDELKKYESSVKKSQINDIAQQVLKNLPNIENRAPVKKFIEKIRFVDNNLEGHPFQQVISQLTKALENPYKKTRENLVNTNTKNITGEKTTTEIHFQKLLNSLDLNNPEINDKIKEIKSIIIKLEKENIITKDEKIKLEKAIDELKNNPKSTTTLFEDHALEFMASKFPDFKKALEIARPSFKNTQFDKKSLLLKHLKSNTLKQVISNIEIATKEIDDKLTMNRLELVISNIKTAHGFTSEFIKNFPIFIKYIENLNLISANAFKSQSEKLLESYNSKEFIEILNNYSYLNPIAYIPTFCAIIEKAYTENFTLAHLCSVEFKETADKNLESCQNYSLEYFKEYYKALFLSKHLWLNDNILSIKKHYNQGDDPDYSAGAGVCYANTLERHKLLWSNEQITAKDIPLRSTDQGRKIMASFRQHHKDILAVHTHDPSLSDKIWYEVNSKTIASLGLEAAQVNPYKISGTGDVVNNLWEAIKNIGKETGGPIHTVCVIRKPGGEGHAINIQINIKLKIFRMIDDNLGVVEWSSLADCKKQLCAYLKTFYPDFTEIQLEFYKIK